MEARLIAQMQRQKAALDAVKGENERLRYGRNAAWRCLLDWLCRFRPFQKSILSVLDYCRALLIALLRDKNSVGT